MDGLLDEVKELLKPLAKNNEALEAVTVGAVKYSVLKTGCEQNVAFDIKNSVSLEGNSGPYLQYTYARSRSILERAKFSIFNFQFSKRSILIKKKRFYSGLYTVTRKSLFRRRRNWRQTWWRILFMM